jgi:hypothetical protein
MRTLLFLFVLWVNNPVFSQGIVFETDWKTAREKAKKEKKLIFVAYTIDWVEQSYRLEKFIYADTLLGDYFNQNFISVKINAEKEAGKRLSEAYNLAQSPQFLFIHADNLDVISRKILTNMKEVFLEMGKKAFQYKDITPLSILQKKYDAGQRDKAFLENLMQRKSLCGINVKEEMKVYLQNNALDELILTIDDVHKYIINVEFTSSDYSFFKNIKRKSQAVELFIGPLLFRSTTIAFDSVNKRRDIALLSRVLNEIRVVQSPQKAEYCKVIYAQGDSNTLGLMNVTSRYVNTYLKIDSISEIRRQDSISYIEAIKRYRNRDDSLMGRGAFLSIDSVSDFIKHSKASMIAYSISDLVEPLLVQLKDRNQLQTALNLTKYAYDLMPNSYSTQYTYALNLYKLGDKSKAISLMNNVLGYVKSPKNVHFFKEKEIEKYTQCYQKMQKGIL